MAKDWITVKRILVLLLLLPSVVWATDWHVDASQTDPAEDGSEAHPYNSVGDFTTSAGDSVLFKAGTTYSTTQIAPVSGSCRTSPGHRSTRWG